MDQTHAADRAPVANGALAALTHAAHQLMLTADADQLAHALGCDLAPPDLTVREAAAHLGLRSALSQGPGCPLAALPLPALLKRDDRWYTITAITPAGWQLFDPASGSSLQPLPSQAEAAQWHFLLLAQQDLTPAEVKFGLGWFSPAVLRQQKQLRDVFCFAILLQLIALASPLLFENIIDKVLVGRSLGSLHVLALAMVALACAEPLYGFLRGQVFGHLANQVNAELSGKLYRHLVGLPIGYFKTRQTGQIIARVKEMAQIRQFLTGSTLMLVLDLLFILLFVGVMFHYAPRLTACVLGSLLIYFLLWLLIGPLVRKKVEAEYQADADATSFLTEAVTGIETIKTTATERRFYQEWQRLLARQLRRGFQAKKVGLAAGQGIDLVQKLTAALLLWLGVGEVLNGRMSPGELVAFNMLAGHVTQPVLRLAQVWQDFQHTLIALRRVGDILDEAPEHGNHGLASVPALQGAIEFRHTRFRYQPDAPEVLANLSFAIEPGQFIGITGPSGCGKSTLTRLLQRLYVPQHGQVLVDNMDLAIADPVSLRRNMSVVLQESVLFSGTIADNIRICRPDATQAELEQAAQLAGALTFIRELPQGFEQQVGEKGARLSGGQRQRIALARALLVNPRILLLDEATSALDYESEAAIMANMAAIRRGRTLISIAHRLNTLREADRILVMEAGQIVESGSHHELLAREGLYARLWRQQTVDDELPAMARTG
ncbi:type I secretion system permease/ATPase [Aeromonas dhakensis]|uniref:type I secretion system permease/ATPase n=1 Tax=Aeromonas dhakensis TaxID=196024 RepID=UPI00214BA71B|nr:type I secretion system permease/ATPase [Aeromonas dhakensis]MBW3692545.1 type I secretion system permease/ATPase [Aeromonas dhakensis]